MQIRALSWRVVAATRVAVEATADQLSALDSLLVAEQGPRYSEEPWTPAKFRAERPLKFELSRLGLTGHEVCAFAIASQADDAVVHVHRFGVAPPERGGGLGSALAGALHLQARNAGAERVTLYVSESNEAARQFYRRAGYTPVVLHGRPGMERLL